MCGCNCTDTFSLLQSLFGMAIKLRNTCRLYKGKSMEISTEQDDQQTNDCEALSAQEILEESGVPNLLQGRILRLNIF